MKNNNILFFLIAISLLLTGLSYATTTDKVPSPARNMPYTDFLTIGSTAQATVTTITQIATGGYVLIYNESGGTLRVGTDTTVLTTGFGMPENSSLGVRLWRTQPLYIACSTTCDISYIRGN